MEIQRKIRTNLERRRKLKKKRKSEARNNVTVHQVRVQVKASRAVNQALKVQQNPHPVLVR